MGSAIASALAQAGDKYTITITNPSQGKLSSLKRQFPAIMTTNNNVDAADGADILILAVKPWILPDVLQELLPTLREQCTPLISIAGGVSLDKLKGMLPDDFCSELFYVIPDTAIMVGAGISFIATENGSEEITDIVCEAFSTMGEAYVIEPRLMGAATALCSCGIAYVYKYIQASAQAGVELGFRPADALNYTLATLNGAVQMLSKLHTLPQQEIDRVTTPGGMTIRGINELEHAGFTSAVINAILKPLK